MAIASDGIHALVDRDFASMENRAWNVIARLTGIPSLFRDARANLDDAPPRWVRRAIDDAAVLVHLLANQLAGKLEPVRDPVLREEFDHHLASAVGAVAEYRHWLRTDLLPRSADAEDSSFEADSLVRRGPARFVTPLDSLLSR